MAAWLSAGPTGTVVSHESALDLLNLSDVIPNAIHLTVPRSRRHLPRLPGVAFHTTTRPLRREDITIREGIRLTDPTRTIVDAAEMGTAPEQIEMAIAQALSRGWTTPTRLLEEASGRASRVSRLVADGIDQVA
jgi:predicted transcriptional regulator of viral defense system